MIIFEIKIINMMQRKKENVFAQEFTVIIVFSFY